MKSKQPSKDGFFVGEAKLRKARLHLHPKIFAGQTNRQAKPLLLCPQTDHLPEFKPVPNGESGIKQASAICKSLSFAKLMAKSQAMGSASRNSAFTTTQRMPLIRVGMHQGEYVRWLPGCGPPGLKGLITPHKRSAQSLGRKVLPSRVMP